MTLLDLRIPARVLTISLALSLTTAFLGAQGQPPQPQPGPQSTGDPGQQPFIFQEITTRFRFERDGRGFKESYILVKLQTDLGIRQWGQMAFLYTPASQELTVPLLEVRKADGSVIRPGNSAITDAAVQPEAAINMFQDLRQTHITVPSLSVGDSLAIRLVWKTHTPVAKDHFWFEHDFTRAAIVLDERLELDLPESLTPTIRVAPDAPAEGSALKGTVEGGRRLLRWKTLNRELPKEGTGEKPADNEEEAPVSDVRVSTFPNWDSVVGWYRGLASPSVVVDEKVRAKALELTRGATAEDERIQALYDFVSTEIRYVSLSFGLGRYSPHPASEVLANQYGDCKDKHTLLAAMLKAIGIEAWPVLANGARKIDPAMPSPAEFSHLMTVVPRGTSSSEWLWLDTTPGVAPYRMLLANLRDRDVLVVAPPTGKASPDVTPILRTPADAPFPMTTVVEISGRIDALGALKGVVRYTTRGDDELMLRSLLLNIPPDKRIEAAMGMAEAMKLDGNVTDFKATNLDSTRQPLTVEFSVRRAGFFKWTNGGATLSLPMAPMELPYDTDEDWKKRTRGKLGSPIHSTLKAILELPANYTPTLPVGINVTRDGYDFKSGYRVDAQRVVAERVLRTRHREVVASSSPQYLAFVRAVRADEAQKVELAFDTNAVPDIPSDATASELYSVGHDAYKNKRYDVAVAFWNGTAKLAPKDDSVWDALGLAYEQLKRPSEALAALRKQTEVSPFHHQAFKNLARVLKQQKQHDEARKALAKHVEIAPLDGKALSDLGKWLFDADEYAEAAIHLEKATAIAKNDAWAHARLGAAYAALKVTDKARKSIEQAISLSPSPAIWTFAGWQLAQHGMEMAWAEELSRKTLTHAADTMKSLTLTAVTDDHWDLVERIGWSWDAIGWIHFQKGNSQLAERYVKAAWMLAGEAAMMDHLGQIYEKQARLADAGSAYLTALALDQSSKPTAERAHRILGKNADLTNLLAAAPKTAFMERPVRVSPGKPVDGRAELTVMVKLNGSIAEALFGKGDEALRALVTTVRATTFPMPFPDDMISQLPLDMRVQCRSNPAECWAAVVPASLKQ